MLRTPAQSLSLLRRPISSSSLIGKIIHGEEPPKDDSPEGHSKKVARGKYVHEFQFHRVKPDRWDEYNEICQHYLPKFAQGVVHSAQIVGSFSTDIGENEQAVHIWRYSNYEGLDQAYSKLRVDPQFQEYNKKLRSVINSRTNEICQEFAYWYTEEVKKPSPNGFYELRSYRLKPGRLLEWEQQWRVGLEYRRKYCQPVGAWFTQIGALHQVQHMWYYPDFSSRKETREAAWKNPGWAETVHKTVPLVEVMDSQILRPMSFSPMK